MNIKSVGLVGTIALLALTACNDPSPTPEANPEADTPSSAVDTSATAELPEGVSLSDDGQMVVMEQFSNLDVYCMDGDGALAISYVGEGKFDHQVVACGTAYDAFNAARENDFAEVTPVTPILNDNGLQLQEGQYAQVQCLSDHAGLDPAAGVDSEGHMVLNCL